MNLRVFGHRGFTTAVIVIAAGSGPLLMMGMELPFFFVPVTTLALASVEKHEIASARAS